MLGEIEFPIVIQLVFKYLNTDISIYDFIELEECKNLSMPFTKCLTKISSNKTIHYNEKKYLWSELSKKVREKMEIDKMNLVGHLAIIYLDGDFTISFLASLPEVPFSSSSLQRHFKDLIPKIPKIEYSDKVYTGEEFGQLLNEKLKMQKSEAPRKGGIESSIKATFLKDESNHFIGSIKNEKIAGIHFPDIYERAKYEAQLMKIYNSSTWKVGEIQGFNHTTILRDFHVILQNSNPQLYREIKKQLEENQNRARDEKGQFLDTEEKYQKQKKCRNRR